MARVFQPNVFQPDVFQVGTVTTGTIAGTQAAQSGALTAREDFKAAVAASQAAQTAALAAAERFIAAVAAAQGVQTEASSGLLAFVASIAGSQAAQTEAAQGLTVAAPVAETSTPPRHGPPLGAAIVKGPAGNRTAKPVFLVVVGGVQRAQREQIALEHAENEDWLIFGEELAA